MKQAWVVALLILPIVLATNTIETSQTNITLEGSTAYIEQELTILAPEAIGNLTLILTPQAKSVQVKINNEQKSCLVQSDFARCGTITNGTHKIQLSYETSYPIAQSAENTIVKYTDRLPYPAENQEITLKLPIGYIIPREKGKDDSFYITPTPKEVYSDGQRIILYWQQKGQELPISAITRKVIGPPIAWIITTGLAILLAAGTAIWFILQKPKIKTQKQKKKQIIVPTLIDNEQKIVEFLKTNGEVWQKQIQQATQFSKAKVSRVIRNLETRGVITKTPYGNTNKIALKQK